MFKRYAPLGFIALAVSLFIASLANADVTVYPPAGTGSSGLQFSNGIVSASGVAPTTANLCLVTGTSGKTASFGACSAYTGTVTNVALSTSTTGVTASCSNGSTNAACTVNLTPSSLVGITAAQVGADVSGAASAVQASSLQKASNLSDVANAATSRTNLGLGTAATQASTAFDVAGAAAAVTTTSIGAVPLNGALGTPTSGTATNLTGTATALNIGGNAATSTLATNVTTNANLTGQVTSVGNATTVASLPAISGASLTNLTAANISAGTAGISITGNAATATNSSTVTTNANLTGGVTSVGNAATVVTNANLTGGVTSVGNAATVVTNANLTGDVTSIGNATTAVQIGGASASSVAAATSLANAATNANTASTIVKRDASGNFTAGTITAALTGTASGNLVSGGALGTPSSGTITNLTGTATGATVGNATSSVTATNQSGGTVSATTGNFSGVLTTSGVAASTGTNTGNWNGFANSYILPANVGGTSDAITLTPTPAITSYVEGQTWNFDAKFSNTTAAATININGIGTGLAYMGSVQLPIGGLISGQKYWVAVEMPGPTFRIAPFDTVSSNGDTMNGALQVISTAGPLLTATSTTAHGAAAGAGITASSDSGAALTTGDQLGYLRFSGALDASHTIYEAAGVYATAVQPWTGTNAGSSLIFQTTLNNSLTKSTALTLGQNKLATFAGGITSSAAANTFGASSVTTLSSSGVHNFTAQGDAITLGTDVSRMHIGSWNTTASGALYTLAGDFVDYYQLHNCPIDASGNFLGREDVGVCYMSIMTEGGIYTQYNAVTASAGVVPTWVLQQTLNTNTGALTVAGGITSTAAANSFGATAFSGAIIGNQNALFGTIGATGNVSISSGSATAYFVADSTTNTQLRLFQSGTYSGGLSAVAANGTGITVASNGTMNFSVNSGSTNVATLNTSALNLSVPITGGQAATLGATSVSTLGSSGNVSFGGGAISVAAVIAITPSITSTTGATQYGLVSTPVASASATNAGVGIYSAVGTTASAYTMTTGSGIFIADATKGAGSTITTLIGLNIANQTLGGTNYAIKTGTGLVSLGDSLAVTGAVTSTGAFGTFQTGGALTGALNGSNQTYTLPQIPKQLPLILINGLGATNAVEYTLSGATLTHIGTALGSGETITFAGYQY